MSTENLERIARASRRDANRLLANTGMALRSPSAGLSHSREWAWLTGAPYPEGVPYAGEREAMGLPPFGRGVALLANAVAATQWRAMRWDAAAGVPVRVPDQPAVLLDPDPTTTPWHYRWSATEDLILYGNHFALYGDNNGLPDYRTGRPPWLVAIPADDVWLVIDPETGGWNWTVGGTLRTQDEIFHVSAGNRSGEILGRGVLAQYGEWLGGSIAAETHAGNYFAGGALPPAVLQSPTLLTQAQADDLKTKWREMTNTREPVILPNGYVLTPVVSNADSAQLVESRQWNAAAAAMILGIPSYKLGLAGPSMTYQNIESADIEFVRDSVDRFAGPLVAAFSKWLMPRGTDVAWDYAGRMRADNKTTAEVVGSLVASGLLTLDEGRAMIGRAPLPDPEPAQEAPTANLTGEQLEAGPVPLEPATGPTEGPEQLTPQEAT